MFVVLWQIVSPFPPSDKIGTYSIQNEEIIDMNEMNMDWVPWYWFSLILLNYISLFVRWIHLYESHFYRGSSIERLESQIFILRRDQEKYSSLLRFLFSFYFCWFNVYFTTSLVLNSVPNVVDYLILSQRWARSRET